MVIHMRLVVSYIIDWIIVVVFAAGGGVLTYITGYQRPFNLADPSIAYPLKSDIISLSTAIILSLIVPVIIIAAVSIGYALLPPLNSRPFLARIGDIAWEVHAGWLGLCAGLASTLFITAGLKDMVGKPRPDFLARCNPDLTNLSKYIVGGLGKTLESQASPLVTAAVCQQADSHLLNDGFTSFPSGHSSFSSAGMVYLTLWLCSRWNIIVCRQVNRNTIYQHPYEDDRESQLLGERGDATEATGPLWLTAIAALPIVLMLFICSSRYADYHHAGIDTFAGALIGTFLAWCCFRLYHAVPRRPTKSLAWAPRSASGAFLNWGVRRERFVTETELGPLECELQRRENEQGPRATSGNSREPILAT